MLVGAILAATADATDDAADAGDDAAGPLMGQCSAGVVDL